MVQVARPAVRVHARSHIISVNGQQADDGMCLTSDACMYTTVLHIMGSRLMVQYELCV